MYYYLKKSTSPRQLMADTFRVKHAYQRNTAGCIQKNPQAGYVHLYQTCLGILAKNTIIIFFTFVPLILLVELSFANGVVLVTQCSLYRSELVVPNSLKKYIGVDSYASREPRALYKELRTKGNSDHMCKSGILFGLYFVCCCWAYSIDLKGRDSVQFPQKNLSVQRLVRCYDKKINCLLVIFPLVIK